MKKIPITVETKGLCLLFVLIALCGNVKSKGIFPGGYEHVLGVKSYSDWGKGYLTIIDDATIIEVIRGSGVRIAGPFTHERGGESGNSIISGDSYIAIGDLILEVDGMSAKGWSERRFYNYIEGKNDTIYLKVRRKLFEDNGPIIKDKNIWILPTKDIPAEFVKYKMYGDFVGCRNRVSEIENRNQTAFGTTWSTRIDEDFDFFYVLYYDYEINSSDPLFDKELLEKMKGNLALASMIRREENPDIIFTVAKSADESISTTYIPPSSRTVYTGSTTTADYGVATGRYLGSTTRHNSYTVREGGYTKETKTADLYLEITALDAKKINDPKQTYPPIVWQTIAKKHMTNYSSNVNEVLKTLASKCFFPIRDRNSWTCYDNDLHWVLPDLGIVSKSDDNHIIERICPGMFGEKIGLKSGDKLIKVDFEDKQLNNRWDIRRHGWNFYGSDDLRNCNIVIRRNGKKITFKVRTEKLEYIHLYYL